jgi:hypothetical protein
MGSDDTAAAYGLLQVVFAHVTDQLAYSLFTLIQRRDATVSFEKIFRCEFGRMLSAFKAELRQFKDAPLLHVELIELRNTCQELKSLSKWRNERIHARVQVVGDGLALYSGKTRERLSMNYAECANIRQRLVRALVILQTNVPRLVDDLDFKEKFDAIWKEYVDSED